MENIKSKTVNGIKWTTFQTLIISISAFALQFVRARFLSPAEYGILAIILIFEGFFKMFENLGISQSIINKQNIDYLEISSLNIFNIIIGIFLSLILYVSAPLIAKIYSMDVLIILLRVECLNILLNSPSHIFRALLEKKFEFKNLSIVSILRSILTLILTYIFLVNNFGILGIVISNIISTLLYTIFVVYFCLNQQYFKISFYFSIKTIKPFLKFGISVSGVQIIGYITQRMDELLIGYFLDPEVLGIYSFGKSLLKKIRDLINSSFSKVLLPLFSLKSKSNSELKKIYYQFSKYISFFAFPIFIGISITSKEFVPLFFGKEWIDSIIIFQSLGLFYCFWILTGSLATSMLLAKDKPNLLFRIELIVNSLYLLFLFIFARLGLYSIIILYCCYVFIRFVILQENVVNLLSDSIFSYFKNISLSFFLSIMMGICINIIQIYLLLDLSLLFQLLISIISGVIIYLFFGYIFCKDIYKDIKKLFFLK